MIALFRGTGPVAAAIRWQTRGAYAHAAWILRDGSCVESHAKSGVDWMDHPWVQNDGLADIFEVKDLTDAERRKIESFLVRQCGNGYDWLGVLRFLSGVNRNNVERWFCSELVAEGCEMAGRPLLRTDAWRISPVTLGWSTELVPIARGVGIEWWGATFGGMRNGECGMRNCAEVRP